MSKRHKGQRSQQSRTAKSMPKVEAPSGFPEFPPEMRQRLTAYVDMVGRTGAQEVKIRWSDDHEPLLWMAVAHYVVDDTGRPLPAGSDGATAWKIGCGLDPVRAVFDLLEDAVDGAQCTHCHKPTGVTDNVELMPLDELVCWYAWDPELKTIRRGCAGD